jgi:DNA-directed RNA polymerase subunit RPC12/RpoP
MATGVKCPNCRNTNLQTTVENDTKGGHSAARGCLGFLFFGPLGILCGNKKIQTQSRTYWVCQNCGNKFRNFQELIAEEHAKFTSCIKSAVLLVLAALFSFFGLEVVWLGLILLVIGAIFVLLGVLAKKNEAKIEAEYQENINSEQ